MVVFAVLTTMLTVLAMFAITMFAVLTVAVFTVLAVFFMVLAMMLAVVFAVMLTMATLFVGVFSVGDNRQGKTKDSSQEKGLFHYIQFPILPIGF
ncbi:hypothetical protein KOEU_04350 [Komagataeibacter europaeus]|uniref:Uncharacterized protein n=1 Tax=Komagataeibacter europaeus TaxID=33995 RepID=A0A0M0EKI0_KOMEU|nr:hypothetical protein [Komagataeibacter europaeus]KON65748.1 hypothetical protein KOEU_04350 [Komagataeibacter europaeus]